MRIGILTYHHVINDGAVMQTLGHFYTLKELFPDAEIEVIDYRYKTIEQAEKFESFKPLIKFKRGSFSKIKRYYNFKKFVSELLPLTKVKLISNNLDEAVKFINNQNYDYIIVGSDEVWKILNTKYSRKFPNIYFLPNEIKAKKIASAVSSNGSNPDFLNHKKVKQYLIKHLNGFDSIAVRDTYTYKLIKSLNIDINCSQVPDPTFGVEFFAIGVKEKLIKAGVDFNRRRFAINLRSSVKEYSIVSKLLFNYAKENDIQLVGIGQYNKYCEINFSNTLNSLEWATCYQYFDFCISDRFHSTIFSIKNNIPFMVIELKQKYPTEHKGKIVDLLYKANLLENHFFFDESENYVKKIYAITNNFKNINYSHIIEKLKKEFREHLKNCIK